MTVSEPKPLDEYAALRLAPGEYLVLVPRRSITTDQAVRMRDQIPAEIRSRVLVVADMDTYVVDSESAAPAPTQPEE